MPSSDVAPLRIYCVCGQKMKVSEDMYGRPGKCVACRLKIRIPTPDEIPPNTDVIHLKDHPELLRKVKKGGAAEGKPREKEEVEVAPLPDIDPKGKVRKALGPLDVLEPLRIVHSLAAKLEKQLAGAQAVKETKSLDEAARKDPQVAEWLGVRARIRAAEQDLEEELRQRLMETAIELAATQEKLAELNLAVRVGELPYADYRSQVDRLRRRRDNHERRQSNLRGWLTVDDVHRAGGMADVSFDQIPKGAIRITFANELDDNVTLLDGHIEGLRQSLSARAHAERKLTEAKKIKSASGNGVSAVELVADAKAQHERAQAQVQYARERLEQLADDYSNDVQAIDAQLDHARGRLQVGQLKREEFAQTEEHLLRAKTDLTKARALVVRALNANNADEVPRARGTFVARLAHGKPGLRAPVDAWVAWAGAGLVLVSLFLPIGDGKTALQLARLDSASGATGHWFVLFPIFVAVLSVLTAFVPGLSARGLGYCAVWLLGCLLTTAFIHESGYSDSPASEALRIGGPVLLRPGTIVYGLGLLAMAVAGALTLMVTRDGRIILPLTAVATIAGVGAVITDLGGIRTPKPELRIDVRALTDTAQPVHEATIIVSNAGGREMLLASNSTVANAYALTVEKRIGKNSGIDVSAPVSVRVGAVQVPPGSFPVPRLPVRPGESAVLTYQLPVGDYRATLKSAKGSVEQDRSFTLEPLAVSPPDGVPNEASAAQTPETQQRPAPSSLLMEALSAEATLRGVLTSGDRPARFSIAVTLPDGATSERAYTIGDEVFTNWVVSEFNPSEQTVTLTKGNRIVILRRGEPEKLDPGIGK